MQAAPAVQDKAPTSNEGGGADPKLPLGEEESEFHAPAHSEVAERAADMQTQEQAVVAETKKRVVQVEAHDVPVPGPAEAAAAPPPKKIRPEDVVPFAGSGDGGQAGAAPTPAEGEHEANEEAEAGQDASRDTRHASFTGDDEAPPGTVGSPDKAAPTPTAAFGTPSDRRATARPHRDGVFVCATGLPWRIGPVCVRQLGVP
jgi:hypothetical protein